jgi:hypothetical protein
MTDPRTSSWRDHGRPGYFGADRDERHASYNVLYGPANWRLIWKFDLAILDRAALCQVYEDAYYFFLQSHPAVLDQLCDEASDVYDDAPSNTASATDYTVQETGRTHVQDIAIRRCLPRLGRRFEGDRLIQIRHSDGTHPLSLILSPGKVPFHVSGHIFNRPRITGWWDDNSVEDFYQSNKFLQVRKEVLQVTEQARQPGSAAAQSADEIADMTSQIEDDLITTYPGM